MSEPRESGTERLPAGGIELEVLRRGSGRPLLLLHGFQTIDPRARFLELLGRCGRIIAPSHQGFGRSGRPDGFETVYDLAHLYLDLLNRWADEPPILIGFSFGGWLAAEIAVSCGARIEKLVLVDALGIKIGDRETADRLDIFNSTPDEVLRASWFDPAAHAPDYNSMPDEEIIIRARNWDALCLYGWQPYMHNPPLRRWLGRITVPTLVVWGASDGIVTPDYGRAFSALIPGSRFALIEGAGHHPEIEQPDAFAEVVAEFLAR